METIDIKEFKSAKEAKLPQSLEELSIEERERLKFLGVDESLKRGGEYIQIDAKPFICKKREAKGLEMLPITEALKKYDWISDYFWKLVNPEKDEFTKAVAEDLDDGYFIRVLPGHKLVYPVQTCLYIRTDKVAQKVHNIVIVEEGAELNLITSCSVHPHLSSAFHIGISEFYVKRGGTLTFSMLHVWDKRTYVRPRTGVLIEEGGTYISTYVSLFPVKSIQTAPVCRLVGPNAKASFISIIANHPDSHIDIGGEIRLEAEETATEITSRVVVYGGENIARGKIVAKAPKVKGHLECQGLMLSDEGVMRAIPELDSHFYDVELTHEAAVGKIAREEVEYLMARGLTEEEATSLIVKGFLRVKIEGIPPELQKQIDKTLELAKLGF
ncbi:MAG: SufD family Fe-S cluster assembly protein [Thermodesulfobacteriaceae bacterium]|nr:SufD family Fe-S cluster assembly protein [Thermodesulfobacteriaceae bacterium]MCX8042007.1 SufD family Fe-S cluster assembly protein [Thermodesulfobacteriaceae bacterium]MDW8136429.1 SufD family Fe-S cluster assembly protein [Thermodesulfobacterium sp.]